MTTINEEIIEQAISALGGKLRDNRQLIDEAFMKIEGDLTVSLPVKFKPSARGDAVDAEIGIKFKIDEINEKDKYTFAAGKPGQKNSKSDGEIFDAAARERERRREILFRDFRQFAATLAMSVNYQQRLLLRGNSILFKTFDLRKAA